MRNSQNTFSEPDTIYRTCFIDWHSERANIRDRVPIDGLKTIARNHGNISRQNPIDRDRGIEIVPRSVQEIKKLDEIISRLSSFKS